MIVPAINAVITAPNVMMPQLVQSVTMDTNLAKIHQVERFSVLAGVMTNNTGMDLAVEIVTQAVILVQMVTLVIPA